MAGSDPPVRRTDPSVAADIGTYRFTTSQGCNIYSKFSLTSAANHTSIYICGVITTCRIFRGTGLVRLDALMIGTILIIGAIVGV